MAMNAFFWFLEQTSSADPASSGAKKILKHFLQSTVVKSSEVAMSRDKISSKAQLMTMIFAK